MILSSPHASSAVLTLQDHPSENYHGFSDLLTSQAILERETEASMPPLRLHCLELCMLAFAEVRGQESSGRMCRGINFKKWVPRTLLGDCPGKLTGPSELLCRSLAVTLTSRSSLKATDWACVCKWLHYSHCLNTAKQWCSRNHRNMNS